MSLPRDLLLGAIENSKAKSFEHNTRKDARFSIALICLSVPSSGIYGVPRFRQNVRNPSRTFNFGVRMRYLLVVGLLVSWVAMADVPRTASGKPDFSGFYNTNMLIPLERPSEYGEEKYMTEAQSQSNLGIADFLESSDKKSDPNRGAPNGGRPYRRLAFCGLDSKLSFGEVGGSKPTNAFVDGGNRSGKVS